MSSDHSCILELLAELAQVLGFGVVSLYGSLNALSEGFLSFHVFFFYFLLILNRRCQVLLECTLPTGLIDTCRLFLS